MINNIHFHTKKCSNLTDDEILRSSNLFSEHYGRYSKNAPKRAGEHIKLGSQYYKNLRDLSNTYVSLAFSGSDLIGHAYYILDKSGGGYLSWILQLVVHKSFRRRMVGKRLLLSVWGFSNDRAWGLATTNPLTIKTLESSTFRRVSFSAMERNIGMIQYIANLVPFVKGKNLEVCKENATVMTDFFVDHSNLPRLISQYGSDQWAYGKLKEGEEWLAFVFQGQELVDISKKKLDQLFHFSERMLVEAYSRMQMVTHPWTKGTKRDVDFICDYLSNRDVEIIDFGCGTGRHLLELYSRGYEKVMGIDFSERHIQHCRGTNGNLQSRFQVRDCRTYRTFKKYDVALCLYDVIGSFVEDKENAKIIKSVYKSLKKGGIAFVSVMNMELTENIAKNTTNVYENPKKLMKLKSSNTMQVSGNIFNPDFFLIDTSSGAVFRKEKFTNDGDIAAEYLVRDRRYYMSTISRMVEKVGFSVHEARYVRAGDWQTDRKSTDMLAKEVLLVLRK